MRDVLFWDRQISISEALKKERLSRNADNVFGSLAGAHQEGGEQFVLGGGAIDVFLVAGLGEGLGRAGARRAGGTACHGGVLAAPSRGDPLPEDL